MIAANDDRCFEFSACNHFIECQSQAMSLPKPDPADSRRQSLKLNAITCHIQPAMQMWVVGDELFYLGIRLVNILWVTAQGDPAKRTDAATKQRSNIRRNETGKIKGISNAVVFGNLPNVIAVVECGNSQPVKFKHGADVHGHGLTGRLTQAFRVFLLSRRPLLYAPA